MISTISLSLILFLIVGIIIAGFWVIISRKNVSIVTSKEYARGMNASEGRDVILKCDGSDEICVYRATQICTSPDQNNFEQAYGDPFSDGVTSSKEYGEFSEFSVDLTEDISNLANGLNSYEFTFTAKTFPNIPGGKCINKSGDPGIPQLIGVYKCLPPGGKCGGL